MLLVYLKQVSSPHHCFIFVKQEWRSICHPLFVHARTEQHSHDSQLGIWKPELVQPMCCGTKAILMNLAGPSSFIPTVTMVILPTCETPRRQNCLSYYTVGHELIIPSLFCCLSWKLFEAVLFWVAPPPLGVPPLIVPVRTWIMAQCEDK